MDFSNCEDTFDIFPGSPSPWHEVMEPRAQTRCSSCSNCSKGPYTHKVVSLKLGDPDIDPKIL